MRIQSNLGSDVAMAFDECVENPAPYDYAKASCERTLRWLERCAAEHERLKSCLAEEIERLKEQITALRGEHHRQSETLTVDNPWLKTFSGLQLPDRLNRNLACALIQRITIYAENKIDVIFKYQDEREHLLTAINEEEVSA